MTDKPTYQELEQKILFLEQELQDKNTSLLCLKSNFDEIQKLAKTGHWELDLLSNKLYWSDEIYRIFECSAQEFEATYEAFLSFIHPEDRARVDNAYKSHIVTRSEYNIVHRIISKSGKIKFVNERCKSDFDHNGNPLRSLGTVVDITDQIEIEHELQRAQEKTQEKERDIEEITSSFESFFNTIDDFIFVLDENANIIHCNKTIETRLGYTLAELKDKSVLSVHPEESRSNVSQIVADMINGDTDYCQLSLVTKEGKRIHVEKRVNSGLWNGKPALFVISRDITKLKHFEERFATAFHLNPSACWLSDANNGKYVEVNDALCKLIGFNREEILGRTVDELQILSKQMRDAIRAKSDSAGRITNAEAELITKTGDSRKVLLSGQNIAVHDTIYRYTVVHDVTEINRAKEIAEDNEKKFSMLLNACPEPLSVTSLEDGRFIITNEALHRAYGLGKEDVIDHTSIEINAWVQPEDRQKWATELMKNGSVRGLELQLRTQQGIRSCLISSEIVELDKKKCSVNFYVDITDRKNAEQELLKAKLSIEESERKYKDLYDSLSIAFIIIKDGICIECNQAALTIYQVENKAEIVGKSPIDFSPEFQLDSRKSHEAAEQNIQIAIEKGFHSFEWLAMRKNKELFNAEVSLKTFYHKNELHIQCLTTDITKRKKIEKELIAAKERAERSEHDLQIKNDEYESINEELKQINEELFSAKEKAEESETKFRQLAENLNDVVWYRTGEKLVYINPAFEKLFGIPAAQYYEDSQLLYKIMHPDDVTKYQEALEAKEFIDTGNFCCEYRIIKHDSEIRWIISKSYPIMDKYGNKTMNRVGIAMDITNLKNFEQELITAKEKAEESDLLKTAFLQNMSHEIRTPLNAICGFSGFLGDDNLSGEKRKHFIQIIKSSSNQLLSIVNDILTISALETKQEKINLTSVSINSIIIELLTIFKQQAIKQNISLYAQQQLTDEQSEIYTDKTKITQILSNLLSNALKFTHTGSIEFGYQLINDEIKFYIKDSGIGIQQEQQGKIFERFRQADKTIQTNYGGTGLGLAISKGFVELLGGNIWVQSEINIGSVFYFTIPYHPVKEQYKSLLINKQNEEFKTILIAEDDEYNFLFLEEILIRLGFKLIHAKNGKDVVELYKSNPNCDFILMDIKMPVLSGDEAAKIIKAINPNVPIIAQSAHALKQEKIQFEDVFDGYLTKPIKEETLLEIITKYFDVDTEKNSLK